MKLCGPLFGRPGFPEVERKPDGKNGNGRSDSICHSGGADSRATKSCRQELAMGHAGSMARSTSAMSMSSRHGSPRLSAKPSQAGGAPARAPRASGTWVGGEGGGWVVGGGVWGVEGGWGCGVGGGGKGGGEALWYSSEGSPVLLGWLGFIIKPSFRLNSPICIQLAGEEMIDLSLSFGVFALKSQRGESPLPRFPFGFPLACIWPWVKIQIVPPVNIRLNPTTKIGSKMGGEFTYQPKWDPKTVLTTTAIWPRLVVFGFLGRR